MTIEARKPPPQFAFRLKRALGGRAGWTGFALQILFVALLVWIGYEIVANARANLEAQRITSCFGVLNNTVALSARPSLFYYFFGPSRILFYLPAISNILRLLMLTDF